MAFVVTLLLLMFGAFVVMLFQTRMQQQEMAEQLPAPAGAKAG